MYVVSLAPMEAMEIALDALYASALAVFISMVGSISGLSIDWPAPPHSRPASEYEELFPNNKWNCTLKWIFVRVLILLLYVFRLCLFNVSSIYKLSFLMSPMCVCEGECVCHICIFISIFICVAFRFDSIRFSFIVTLSVVLLVLFAYSFALVSWFLLRQMVFPH